jgi:hypothetical protein
MNLALPSRRTGAAGICAVMVAVAGTLSTAARAQSVAFTVTGDIVSAGQGYAVGAPVAFTWVLDDAAARQADYSGPSVTGVGCCSTTLSWTQEFFSTSPQLWSSISGTGLSGAWQPNADVDNGFVVIGVGDYPQPFPGVFQMLANAQIGWPTGLQAHGFNVTALQVAAVFTGLDALTAVGAATIFGTAPDPVTFFQALAGSYPVDPLFSTFGAIWGSAPGPTQALFRVDQLTITAVPEPGPWALWLAGSGALLLWTRRRRPTRPDAWAAPSPSDPGPGVPAMRHLTSFTMAAAALAGTITLLPVPALAQQVSFTIDGETINNGQGYTPGTPVSFTWVLDAAAPPLARISEPGLGCCSGYIAWYQDLFSSSPQLWSSLSGTGLSGAWLPPTSDDSGSLGLTLGDFPLPYSARLDLVANTQLGSPAGLLVNGFTVWGLQVQASFIGLDALGLYGAGAFFGVPASMLPDATAMFLGLAGTYPADTAFTTFGSIWGAAPSGPSQARFRVDQLTISAVVPEPQTGLMLAGGLLIVGALRMRRRRSAA